MDRKLLEGARTGNTSQLKTLLIASNLDEVCRSVAAGDNNLLHIAATFGKKDYAMEFVSHVGPSKVSLQRLLTQPNSSGNTPLHCAALAGHSDFVSFIISKMDHVGIRMKNKNDDTALHLAAAGGSDDYLKIVKMLVDACEELGSEINKSGEYPLYVAAERGSLEILEHLLSFKLFPTTGRKGKTALHAAVARSKGGMFIKSLLEHRKELLTQQDEEASSTPLHYVASSGDRSMAKLLLNYGDHLARPEASDIEEAGGDSLLIRLHHVALICDNTGTSPIHVAAVKGHLGVIRSILEKRPDSCELADKSGRNFLHVAVKHKSIEVVKHVLEKDDLRDILINRQDNNGDTALHLAVRNRHLEIVRLLVKDKLINKVVRNKDGQTALDLAASDVKSSHMEHRMFKIIKSLFISGAEFSARRLDLVEKTNREDIIEVEKEEASRCRDIADNLTIVSVLIATVTFAAAFTLPGGYKNETAGSNEGMAVLSDRLSFKVFLISNTLAMITSMVVTYLLVQTRSLDHDVRIQSIETSKGLMKISIAAMSVAFATATTLVLESTSKWLSVLIFVMSFTVPLALYTVKIWPSWYRKMVSAFSDLMWYMLNEARNSFRKEDETEKKNAQNRKIDRWRPNSMTYFHTPHPQFQKIQRRRDVEAEEVKKKRGVE